MPRILVGYDGSPPSRRALEHALRRAGPADELVLLTVIPPQVRRSSLSAMMPAGIELPPQLSGTFEENARKRLDDLVAQAKLAGRAMRAEVRAGETAEAILRFAKEQDVHEIVIGHKSFEPGAHVKLGPNAERVLRDAGIPVTIVP